MQKSLSESGEEKNIKPSAREMTDCVEAYFARVDSFDVAGTLELMTPDCIFEFVTAGERHVGRDEEVKAAFERRVETVAKAWHGDFTHVVDPESGRVASRFEVRRTDKDGVSRSWDNINFFQFEGLLLKRISVWKSLPKMLK